MLYQLASYVVVEVVLYSLYSLFIVSSRMLYLFLKGKEMGYNILSNSRANHSITKWATH